MNTEKIDQLVNLDNRKIFVISMADRRKLRIIVKKIHLKFLPSNLVTDKEADKLIESLGPTVKEKLLKEALDKNLI